jgi:hypothetical protein
MIMQEIRKRPECHRIESVAVIPPFERNLHTPDWDVVFSVDGNLKAPEVAYRVARALRTNFDLD